MDMSTVKHYIAETAETFVEEAQDSHYLELQPLFKSLILSKNY